MQDALLVIPLTPSGNVYLCCDSDQSFALGIESLISQGTSPLQSVQQQLEYFMPLFSPWPVQYRFSLSNPYPPHEYQNYLVFTKP
ncbi:MAG: hypothetical protein AABX86_00075 [Nanoarchaeota archaeon]